MKRLSIVFLFFTLSACISRDKIEFVDTIEDVSASMRSVSIMLGKTSNGEMRNFFIDNDNFFYINNTKVARFPDLEGVNLNPFFEGGLSKGEKDLLLMNFILLIRNEITSIYLDKYYNQFFFTYKRTPENTIDQLRLLTLNVNFKDFNSDFEILDNQGDLYLLAPIRIE